MEAEGYKRDSHGNVWWVSEQIIPVDEHGQRDESGAMEREAWIREHALFRPMPGQVLDSDGDLWKRQAEGEYAVQGRGSLPYDEMLRGYGPVTVADAPYVSPEQMMALRTAHRGQVLRPYPQLFMGDGYGHIKASPVTAEYTTEYNGRGDVAYAEFTHHDRGQRWAVQWQEFGQYLTVRPSRTGKRYMSPQAVMYTLLAWHDERGWEAAIDRPVLYTDYSPREQRAFDACLEPPELS